MNIQHLMPVVNAPPGDTLAATATFEIEADIHV